MAKELESIIPGSTQYGSIVSEYNWLSHHSTTENLREWGTYLIL